MGAFRMTMTFDLDIGDEFLAQQIAKEYLDNLSLLKLSRTAARWWVTQRRCSRAAER